MTSKKLLPVISTEYTPASDMSFQFFCISQLDVCYKCSCTEYLQSCIWYLYIIKQSRTCCSHSFNNLFLSAGSHGLPNNRHKFAENLLPSFSTSSRGTSFSKSLSRLFSMHFLVQCVSFSQVCCDVSWCFEERQTLTSTRLILFSVSQLSPISAAKNCFTWAYTNFIVLLLVLHLSPSVSSLKNARDQFHVTVVSVLESERVQAFRNFF